MSAIEVTTQVRLKQQFYFVHALKVLHSPECSLAHVYSILEQMAFLVNISTDNSEIQSHFNEFSIQLLRSEFKSNMFKVCFKEIVANFEKFLGKVTTSNKEVGLQQVKSLIVQIMTSTNFSDSFSILYDQCTTLK